MSKRSMHKLDRTNTLEAPMKHEMVEAMAYQLWLERGCPIGSDQEDWYRAEADLKVTNRESQRAA